MRNFFSLTLILATLLGCTGKYTPPRDTLVVAIAAGASTLDPRYAMDAVGVRIGSLIFNSLVRLGPNFDAVPEAAESWKIENRSYIFLIRQDLTFHNGRKATPEDFEFSFQYYLSDKSPFKSSLQSIKSFEVKEVDGRIQVKVNLHSLIDNFLINEMTTIKILPKKELQEAGVDFNQVLIGTGPYKFIHQTLNEVRLQAVTAKTPNLVFKVIRDDLTRYQKVIKGEVDIVQNDIASEKVDTFRSRPDEFQVLTYPGLSMSYILINLKDPLLRNIEVRQALALALNRDEIIKYKGGGLATEATSLLVPQNPYFNSTLKNPPFDLERSQSIIKQLGLVGKKLILKTSNTPQTIDNGRVLANQLSRSGINVQVESYEWATFYDDVKKGRVQLATMKWVGLVDPDIYRLAFHSREVPPGRNRGSYINRFVDELVDKGMTQENRAQRKKIYDQVQSIVHRDLAIIPLWYETQIAIARKSVSNYTPNMSGDYYSLVEAVKE